MGNVQKQAARFIKTDYKSRFEGCVTSMLEDLKLPTLQQRRLESRLVMLYRVVRGMVPAINADEFLVPLRNKRNIKPRLCPDFQTTNYDVTKKKMRTYRLLKQGFGIESYLECINDKSIRKCNM